jgi:hypothetical protein
MFLFHIALSLGLIALSAGMMAKQYVSSGLGKMLAFLVIIVALVSTVCTVACGVMCWRHGDAQCHMGMMKSMMPAQDAQDAPVMKKSEM